MKASSTLVFVWAEVSAKGMPNFSASFLPSSVDTAFPLFHHLTTYSLGLQIALVTNQDLVYARISMLFHKRDGFKLYLRNLFHPWRNALKRVSISHIINKENTFRTSYVRSSNGSETLLTSRLPNLSGQFASIKQTWSFTVFPHTFTVLILKSIPIVVMNVLMNVFEAYCISRQVLPTPTVPLAFSRVKKH